MAGINGDVLSTYLGGLAGLFPDKDTQNQTSTTSGQQTTNQRTSTQFFQDLTNLINTINQQQNNQQTAQTTSYNLDPATQAFLSKLTGQYSNLASARPDLSGYTAGGIQDINRSSDLQSQAVNNIMAARGLATSPVAASAQANVDAQRFGQINQFQQTIPLLQQQLGLQNLNAAGNFFSSIPKGATTTGTTSGTVTNTGSQSTEQHQGGTTLGANDATTTSNQTTNSVGQRKQGGGLGGFIGGLAATAASLFSDARLKEEIKPIDGMLAKLSKVSPVEWKWKGSNRTDKGVLAQELEEQFPELVETDEPTGFRKVDYTGLIPVLLSAVKELDAKVEGK